MEANKIDGPISIYTGGERPPKWVFMLIIILLASAIVFDKCEYNPKVTANNHDSIYKYEAIDNNTLELTAKHNKYLKHIIDSLVMRKPIYVIRYKNKFDSLMIADTSCQNSLITLYNSFGELNDLNDSIIANNNRYKINDSITIATLYNKVRLKQSRIVIDSSRIVALIDTLPKVKRKGYFRGLRHGAAIGAALVGTAVIVKP